VPTNLAEDEELNNEKLNAIDVPCGPILDTSDLINDEHLKVREMIVDVPHSQRGTFKTVSWGTTGSATIERDASGHLVLRLSPDFRTQKAPELFIHMGKKRMALQRASGSQTYVLSHVGVPTLRATVQVFCEKCNKAWGEATLRPTHAA
jgi:hypothetical protein